MVCDCEEGELVENAQEGVEGRGNSLYNNISNNNDNQGLNLQPRHNLCTRTDDFHYQTRLHETLFRAQCPAGAACARVTDPAHVRRYWHRQKQVIYDKEGVSTPFSDPAPPGLFAAAPPRALAPAARGLAVYLPLSMPQLIGLVSAGRFLAQDEVRAGEWWREAPVVSLSNSAALIAGGAQRSSTPTWLHLLERAAPAPAPPQKKF